MKVIDNKIFLEIQELVSFGIPLKTVYNGISRNKRGITSKWEHIKIPGHVAFLILYDKIAGTSLKKLPSKSELLQSFLDEKNKEALLLEAAKKVQNA